MALQITQTPASPFDMSYGPNPITLNGITPNEDKYALRIYIVGQADPIADIRQSPNRYGRAIFDIQNILQSLVGPTENNIDARGYNQTRSLQIAQGELVQYQIAYTTETGGTLDQDFTTDPEVFTVIAGSKQYYEVPFDSTKYQAQIQSTVDGCTVLNPNVKDPQGLALSDNTWTIGEQETGDEFYADNFRSPDGIDMHRVYPDDQLTKSFYNVCRRAGGNPPVFQAQGIETFLLIEFDANGQLVSETEITNTQANGGGPNITTGQGLIPTGNFQVITIGVGPAQLDLNPLTTTYYIQPLVLSPTGGSCGSGGYMIPSGWRTQGFRIQQEECNDYDHIQFAWLNSLGFRDQFTFTKQNEKSINTKRNEFLKEAADYNDTSYNVDEQSRGYTTYSQTIKETWSATTGFINDQEAELLESMFKSAQVNVRFSEGPYKNKWIPVRIQTAKYKQKTNRKDRLFQYTVQFTLASNIKSQRG